MTEKPGASQGHAGKRRATRHSTRTGSGRYQATDVRSRRASRSAGPRRSTVARGELKALGVDTERDLVRIPQGGALSCFLANAILDHPDRAVEATSDSTVERQAVVYLRYCDDIICIATGREQCQRMMDAYTAALKDLRLPVAKPLVFNRPYRPRSRES